LHVAADLSTCFRVTTIAISVDGVLQGVVNPGDGGVSEMVTIGGHTVSAVGLLAVGGTETWKPFTVNVPAAGFNDTLTCVDGGGDGYHQQRPGE
jgi:hypothetical protein